MLLRCSSFALPDIRIVANDVVGGVFLFLAIVNLVNVFREKKD